MVYKIIAIAAVFVAVVTAAPRAQSERSPLDRAENYLREARYAEAESTLSVLSRSSSGDVLQHSLFLLAGLRSSVADAGRIYRRVIDVDPDGDLRHSGRAWMSSPMSPVLVQPGPTPLSQIA